MGSGGGQPPDWLSAVVTLRAPHPSAACLPPFQVRGQGQGHTLRLWSGAQWGLVLQLSSAPPGAQESTVGVHCRGSSPFPPPAPRPVRGEAVPVSWASVQWAEPRVVQSHRPGTPRTTPLHNRETEAHCAPPRGVWGVRCTETPRPRVPEPLPSCLLPRALGDPVCEVPMSRRWGSRTQGGRGRALGRASGPRSPPPPMHSSVRARPATLSSQPRPERSRPLASLSPTARCW